MRAARIVTAGHRSGAGNHGLSAQPWGRHSAGGTVFSFKTYGADAIQDMTENPYRLARDIRGIGFKTADAMAMKLGIEKTATVRSRRYSPMR